MAVSLLQILTSVPAILVRMVELVSIKSTSFHAHASLDIATQNVKVSSLLVLVIVNESHFKKETFPKYCLSMMIVWANVQIIIRNDRTLIRWLVRIPAEVNSNCSGLLTNEYLSRVSNASWIAIYEYLALMKALSRYTNDISVGCSTSNLKTNSHLNWAESRKHYCPTVIDGRWLAEQYKSGGRFWSREFF